MIPTQYCSACGIGPFFLVPARENPTLCLDCADRYVRQSSLDRYTYAAVNAR